MTSTIPVGRLALALILAILLAVACDSGGTAEDGSDSTVVTAGGSMESDAENFGADDEEDKEDEEKKKERSTTVNAAKAFSGDLVLPVVAEGTVRARHATDLKTEIRGSITAVHAREGQSVRRGQMIVKLDDREYEVAVEEARAKYLQALSLLTIEGDDIEFEQLAQEVREEFSNLERLEKSGEITREERIAREVQMDIEALRDGRFRAEIAAARSGVAAARAELERARINLERTEVRAPFDGVITGLTLTRGQQLAANDVVCSIVDNINIEAEVGVLEADLGYVAVGKSVLLAVPALRDTFRVQVDVVSPQFNRESRTCPVLIRVKNVDGRLLPGMFVRALIAGQTFRDRLLVPREAILTRDGRPLLFKVEDGRAKWLYVSLGESNDDLVEITRVLQGGALEPGDQVVVANHLTLAHDAKIKVSKVLPTTDPWVSFRREDE